MKLIGEDMYKNFARLLALCCFFFTAHISVAYATSTESATVIAYLQSLNKVQLESSLKRID